MKPYKSFLFLLVLLLICSALSYSYRQREMAIAEAKRVARERAEREQFVQDSIDAVERRFFLFDTALFFRAELAAVPSRPFEYDTALSEHPWPHSIICCVTARIRNASKPRSSTSPTNGTTNRNR